MKHILIITGGYLNIEFAKEYCKTLSYDKVFVVDKGLEYADALKIQPDYIVGDFDTVNANLLEAYEQKIRQGELQSEIERHPVQKDATDTELALYKALEADADQITLLAATGSRMDHVLANIGLLLQPARKGVACYLVDETNRIRLLQSKKMAECTIKKEEQYGHYLSVIPLTGIVKGLTMEGVLYPLKKQEICQGSSLTVSNEIVDTEARIFIEEGELLVIESKD